MARLRPSAASRWVPCPGSVTLCEQYPETGEESVPAAEGAAAHWAASEVLESFTQGGESGLILAANPRDTVGNLRRASRLYTFRPSGERRHFRQRGFYARRDRRSFYYMGL